MQNKPNSKLSEFGVTSFMTSKYENYELLVVIKNKANLPAFG